MENKPILSLKNLLFLIKDMWIFILVYLITISLVSNYISYLYFDFNIIPYLSTNEILLFNFQSFITIVLVLIALFILLSLSNSTINFVIGILNLLNLIHRRITKSKIKIDFYAFLHKYEIRITTLVSFIAVMLYILYHMLNYSLYHYTTLVTAILGGTLFLSMIAIIKAIEFFFKNIKQILTLVLLLSVTTITLIISQSYNVIKLEKQPQKIIIQLTTHRYETNENFYIIAKLQGFYILHQKKEKTNIIIPRTEIKEEIIITSK